MKIDERKLKELQEKVDKDPDFINSKKYKFSLKEYLAKSRANATDNIIAHFLCITPQMVQEIYDQAVEKIKKYMNIK